METRRQELRSSRPTAIANAVIDLLGEEGSRNTTHRAVDRRLGLAEGSTSVYFRTRQRLLTAAAHRIAELDRADVELLLQSMPPTLTPAEFTGGIVALLAGWAQPPASTRQLARLELLLEARRSEELAAVFAQDRATFVALAHRTLRAMPLTERLSPSDQEALATIVAALIDGLLYDRLLHPRSVLGGPHLEAQLGLLVGGDLTGAESTADPPHVR